MLELAKERQFFADISSTVLDFVAQNEKSIDIAMHKQRVGDYATHIDVGVEDLLSNEIQKRFPEDEILAEEKHADAQISDKRIWIIDPICGTANLARGIKNFCTNIALAEHGVLIASCVIDHSQSEYFWSIGDGVYKNTSKIQPLREDLGIVIDVDFGSVIARSPEQKSHYTQFLNQLLIQTHFELLSFNSSLAFAYTAIGKLDGFFNMSNHPWDIAASAFLMKESGGIITSLNGEAWNLSHVGAIAARTKDIHTKILSLYQTTHS